MRIHKIALATFCSLMLVTQAKADSGAEYDNKIRSMPLYAELTAEANANKNDEGDTTLMHAFINKKAAERPENPRIIIQWLEDRMKTGDSHIFYALFDGELYFRTAKGAESVGQLEQAKELYKMAYVNMRIFEVMALTDVQRCADSTAQGKVTSFAQSRFSIFQHVKKYFTEEDWETFAKLPLAYEEKYTTRPANSELCRSGMEAMKHDLNDPNHTETTIADNNYVGKKVVVKSSTPYQPSFVSDEEWQKRRQSIRTQLVEMWSKEKAN